MITDAVINNAHRKTQEDFFIKIFTSHFICKGTKGYSKFACERELETEHNWNILTPKLWPSALYLSCSPWLLNHGPGVRSAGCWLSLLHLVPLRLQLYSPVHWLVELNCPPSVQFVGLILPSNSYAMIWTRLRNFFRYLAIGMCHFRYLWNGLFDRHQAEITVMQFRGHSLPVRQSMSIMGFFFYLIPFHQPISAHAISSHNCH